MKPRIVITVATSTGKQELSIVKGRPMANGAPAPGPTTKQYAIVYKAIKDLFAAEAVSK